MDIIIRSRRAFQRAKNEGFLGFIVFSETRFIEYAHRTYDHFVIIHSILVENIKRDEKHAEKEQEPKEFENLQILLVQLHTVIDLLFMAGLSHLITICSKEFQRFDVLPFHVMKMYHKLKNHLHSARKWMSKSLFRCILLLVPIQNSAWIHYRSQCVWGQRIQEHVNQGKTLQECTRLCELNPSCKAIVFGVDGTDVCELKSASTSDHPCDAKLYKLDMYVYYREEVQGMHTILH